MTRTEFYSKIPLDALKFVGVYRLPTGLRFRTLSDSAAMQIYDVARATYRARGFKTCHASAVSRTDNRSGHREILVRNLDGVMP